MPCSAGADVIGQLVDHVVQPHVHAGGVDRALRTGSGLVLKPMTTASEADASSTSDSLMSPAPSRRMLIRTSLVIQPLERVADRAQRSLDVRLQHHAQLLDLGGLDLGGRCPRA